MSFNGADTGSAVSRPLILVTGATGTVGSEVIRQLVAKGEKVRALVRDPARAARIGAGFEIATADLSNRGRSLPLSRASPRRSSS